MLANLMWIVTGVSVIGTILNIKKKQICFVIWLFTNSIWTGYDFYIHNYAQSVLFAIYTGLAIWGIVSWRKKDEIQN